MFSCNTYLVNKSTQCKHYIWYRCFYYYYWVSTSGTRVAQWVR